MVTLTESRVFSADSWIIVITSNRIWEVIVHWALRHFTFDTTEFDFTWSLLGSIVLELEELEFLLNHLLYLVYVVAFLLLLLEKRFVTLRYVHDFIFIRITKVMYFLWLIMSWKLHHWTRTRILLFTFNWLWKVIVKLFYFTVLYLIFS